MRKANDRVSKSFQPHWKIILHNFWDIFVPNCDIRSLEISPETSNGRCLGVELDYCGSEHPNCFGFYVKVNRIRGFYLAWRRGNFLSSRPKERVKVHLTHFVDISVDIPLNFGRVMIHYVVARLYSRWNVSTQYRIFGFWCNQNYRLRATYNEEGWFPGLEELQGENVRQPTGKHGLKVISHKRKQGKIKRIPL